MAQIVGKLECSFKDGFQRLFSWFSEGFTAELERSYIRVSLSLETPRRVTLASVHVNIFINILTLAMDDVFTRECVVLVEWFVRSKTVSIDG